MTKRDFQYLEYINENTPTNNGWTKTSEQLPPVDKDVLGYTIEGISIWGYAQFGDQPPRWRNTDEYNDHRITQPDYWMFLPPDPL